MRSIVFAVFFMLFASPAFAICASGVDSTADSFTVRLSGNDRTFNFADLRNGSTALRAAQIQAVMQAHVDVRQPLSSIPVDDPDRSIDPAFPTIFWADADGLRHSNDLLNDHLIGRCANVVVTVTGSGENDLAFGFTTPLVLPEPVD